MRDPKCVAHEIRNPFSKDKYAHLITIWHVDPEKDGTDDSCGWFMRDRHLNQENLKQMIRDWKFEKDYYFDKETNEHLMSAIATTLKLYNMATWIHFKHNRKKQHKFLKENLHHIMWFAENAIDSLRDTIYNRYGAKADERESDIIRLASIVFADVARKDRSWWKAPKWHFWHWEFQIHPLQKIKRRYWDKCSKCGKRGFKGAAMGNYHGTKIWHEDCANDMHKPVGQAKEGVLQG
jgi:predicted transposase YbfD/YdcC